MEPTITTLAGNIMFYLISSLALLIVPGMLAWWAVAQMVNSDRREAESQRAVGRWHFLRFGPAAPVLSLTLCIAGATPVILHQSFSVPVSISIPCAALAALGLVAFLMSMLLWSYASDPAEPAEGKDRRRTVQL